MQEKEVDIRALLMRLSHFSDTLELVVGQTYIVREGEVHTNFNVDALNEGIITVHDLREGLYEGLREYDLKKRQQVKISMEGGTVVPYAINTTFRIEPNLDELKKEISDLSAQEEFIEGYVARYRQNMKDDTDTGVPGHFTRH